MSKAFHDLLDKLGSSEKEQLQDFYNQETQRIQRELEAAVERDLEHLELVNVCYNAFVHSTEFSKSTGYSVRLVDPLYSLGTKIFDLALFRKESSTAILLECKSSVSSRETGKIVNDTLKACELTKSKQGELESSIGEKIQRMEFAICSYPYYTDEIRDTILSKKASLCLWTYHSTPGVIKLVEMGDNIHSE